jgi:hypothetical protein
MEVHQQAALSSRQCQTRTCSKIAAADVKTYTKPSNISSTMTLYNLHPQFEQKTRISKCAHLDICTATSNSSISQLAKRSKSCYLLANAKRKCAALLLPLTYRPTPAVQHQLKP